MSISSFFVDNFSTIYYSSFTHTFPFFLGSILATIAGIGNTTTAFQQQVNTLSIKQAIGLFLGGLGVELLLLFTLQFSSIWTYLIGFLLSSLATATMILLLGYFTRKPKMSKNLQLSSSLQVFLMVSTSSIGPCSLSLHN